MKSGYLKSIETVIAVILVMYIILQIFPTYRTLEEWDYVALQQKGEDSMLTMAHTNELREYVYGKHYSSLNGTLSELLPAYINYNVRANESLVIDNGGPVKPISVNYFLAGKGKYAPVKVELILWYK